MSPGTRAARPFSAVVLGEQSLLIQCCELLLARGHAIRAVVARNRRIVEWCRDHSISCSADFETLERDVPQGSVDYLFSITNLRMLPERLLGLPARMAINFHDGPLPRYAGLNAPVWAIANGEAEHGITWHVMQKGADTGDILVSRRFAIPPDATVFALNAECYQAGLDGFTELVDHIERDALAPRRQDTADRSYFGLSKRPRAAGLLDFSRSAADLARLVRALDFGPYPNPVLLPKLALDAEILLVREAQAVSAAGGAEAGTIEAADSGGITVRCAEGALHIRRLSDLKGADVALATAISRHQLAAGTRLPALERSQADQIDAEIAHIVRHEPYWQQVLQRIEPNELPFAERTSETGATATRELPDLGLDNTSVAAACIALVARLSGRTEFGVGVVTAALMDKPEWLRRFLVPILPMPVDVSMHDGFSRFLGKCASSLADLEQRGAYQCDLIAREPELRGAADPHDLPLRVLRPEAAGQVPSQFLQGAALAIIAPLDGSRPSLVYSRAHFTDAALGDFLDCLAVFARAVAANPDGSIGLLPVLARDTESRLEGFERGELRKTDDLGLCVHQLIEAQTARTPQRIACIFEGEQLSYAELNAAANRLARLLTARGVKRGDLVGVMVERSIEMMISLLATHKAGAAYVPLDPVYPADRIEYMIEDAKLATVITQRAFASRVEPDRAVVLEDLVTRLAGESPDNPGIDVRNTDLAYVIYTSGSTGKPKGVMVEHRNVANFMIGMDARLDAEPGVWLAVTSISFDISVLELFWTLARGFTVVIYADAVRQKAVKAPQRVTRSGAKGLDFSFFYWNVAKDESDYDEEKYRLLIEGAKYADANGFSAVWNPERHFEAFGGLFPNPSVTTAALAMITRHVALRAGSCVVPLHSAIRIAEEWAVVDNLSNGRVGLSIAAGWAPPDFAIRPENFANAKQVMFETTEVVKRLWRGERVSFPGPKGEVMVRTLPRPVQRDLPIWMTTAGNVESFVQAGQKGYNLLTHLLGQTVEEVAEKVRAYRKAWHEAGHKGKGQVTLMLHTLVGPDAEDVERAVRQPLKDYLKSAMFLVKAAAWQFPTFKQMSQEQGRTLDEFFANISDEDLDGLLEFAFQRYFHTSGLFGTPATCLAMVDKVRSADIDEIACLIDFGIPTQTVLDHLPYLNELRASAQSGDTLRPAEDYSLPALLRDHQVTHFQCTPSMATMLVGDPDAASGLSGLRQMMVGGEAFPPELARNLAKLVGGRVTNMYGPTETTIWSAVGDVAAANGRAPTSPVSIGRPLPNQSVYVLDARQQRMPIGLVGELVIGGEGVVRGYWQRSELTDERFLADPYAPGTSPRMYRTGDLARYLPDGRIECLGRLDHQIKIRGYRVELGEIEALLRAVDSVQEAAVILREDQPGDQRLVAYVRPASGHEFKPEDLKSSLRRQLPEFMVPSLMVRVSELPLTPNGKLDRKALPAPARAERVPSETIAPPVGEAEATITDIWKRALGLSQVGTRENFFDIGGHSLLVVQVLAELRQKFSRPIQMTDLFKHTTIEALAGFLGGDGASAKPIDRSKARAEARRAALGRRRRG
ncbi:MAG: LLM class flavin-dependent oxidoreductase [Steroidobacteraceae bacterium]